eukprot:2311463-Prymnesium_polylepis.1
MRASDAGSWLLLAPWRAPDRRALTARAAARAHAARTVKHASTQHQQRAPSTNERALRWIVRPFTLLPYSKRTKSPKVKLKAETATDTNGRGAIAESANTSSARD